MDNRIDAIYGRQSIDKKDSISIESQFEFCRYELKGGEAKEYKDKGYSGKNIERPDFQRLLQDIRLGLIKRVIVYKLDRISRSIVDFAKLMELFKQYDVEFVSCTEKFDTSTPMGRAMLNICIVFAQLERESIQMRVQDAFYSRCTKGYYMRGRTPYGFDTEPIVMDGIKTKKLVENAEMDFAELMFQMYAEPGNSYGDITRYFVKHSIKVYDKALQRAFISKLLRNPVYVQADMDIYEYFKAQGVKIESPPEMFTGDNSCYLYQGREGEEQILVIAPHQGRISSQLWLTVQRKLSQNTSFQNGRKCHNTWLAGKIKCGRCGYALAALRAQNGVTYLRCKQRAENGSCEGAGTLTAQSMEAFVYGEMVKKMQKFHTLKGGKEQSYNPKLTAARVALAKTESEIEKLLDTLSGANPLLLQYANNRIEELDAERQKQLKLVADLTLLTDKPVLYVCNVDEKSAVTGNAYTEAVKAAIAGEKAEMLVVAAATEADIAELESYEERQMFLEDLGLEESGVARLIKSAYKLLNLETFFTTGADESRAWTYVRGMKAPQTAGIIHTDFEKGFIRAEVIKYDDYVALGSEKACRDAGKIGIEGKEYVVQDGDIMHFLFNV